MNIETIYAVIASVFIIVVFIFLFITKTPKNATLKKIQEDRKSKEKQKLLRFTRGNKALTPEQQEELFLLNQKNLNTLKRMWKNEHL